MIYPFILDSVEADAGPVPAMHRVRQQFDVLPAADPVACFAAEWPKVADRIAALPRGARIAVGVGSRGIGDLVPIVRAVVSRLRQAGCEPFIVPAMGSHGGSTAEGQTAVLAELGIGEHSVGAPIHATMEVVSMGAADGIPLYLDRYAAEADAIVLVNRVKPHTDFVGPVESGLLKMLVIGLGKRVGADHYHRLGVVRGLEETIPTAARALLAKLDVLFGVALVENEEHRTAVLRIVPPEEIEATEMELLRLARRHHPGLPLDDIDLLIVDEMGKDISGGGLDPNVVGRTSASWGVRRPRPRVSRIFVRDLSRRSEGNAAGLGMVDAITTRVVEKIDHRATAVGALTACCPEDAKVPMVFPTDRDAILSLLSTVRPTSTDDLRLVHIRNTLELGVLFVSSGCLDSLLSRDAIELDRTPRALAFDGTGWLISPFSAARATRDPAARRETSACD
jgi:hypothetical protein